MHEQLIHDLYKAFSARDHQTMAAAYHDNANFSDPVFASLDGWRIGAMWQMLCERGKDLEIVFSDVHANETHGRAHWQARYSFSATDRKVHNIVDASFEFRDGKIIKHVDSFGLWRWARMALGPVKGGMLGWLPPVQGAIRKQAASGLNQFIEARGLAPA